MTDTPTWTTATLDQTLALRTAAVNLEKEFTGIYGPETIELFLHSSYDQFASRATIPRFLPLVAERFARQRLRALAKVEGLHDDGKPTVLFLCVHNAGRSQMALGFFPTLPVTTRSAGPVAPSPAPRSTPRRSRRCTNVASTSLGSSRSRGPTRSSAPPMS